MSPKVLTPFRGVEILLLALVLSRPLPAQVAAAEVSGTVSGLDDAAVPNATLSFKNLATGITIEAQTNSAGVYSLTSLVPGIYEVSIRADKFSPKVANVTVIAGARQTMNQKLTVASAGGVAPTLGDLGFPEDQTRGNAQDQARRDKRSHMLQMHQRYGLIAAIPLAATIIASGSAGGRNSSATGRDIHGALGIATAGLYFTSAYYAIRAPRVPGTATRGQIRLHKTLAWIHGPGMVLTPILGAMAYAQENRGEKVHGLAKAHSAVAGITAIAYGAAIVSVTIKF